MNASPTARAAQSAVVIPAAPPAPSGAGGGCVAGGGCGAGGAGGVSGRGPGPGRVGVVREGCSLDLVPEDVIDRRLTELQDMPWDRARLLRALGRHAEAITEYMRSITD